MNRYKHLLSPIVIAGHVMKNRIFMTPTTPEYHQEDETWPAENLMHHYWRRARNGAALMTLSGLYQFGEGNPMPHAMRDYFVFDIFKGENHYLSQLIEGIHGFGTYATIQVQHSYPADHDVTAGAPPFGATFTGEVHPAPYELTPAQIRKCTEELVEKCVLLKRIGLDGVFLHMSYQQMLTGRMLSPPINKRTDEYGGSFENRLRLVTETCAAIKEACGKGFIIEAHITGEERDQNGLLIPGGWTLDDSVRFAEAMSGLIDVLHLRGWDIDKQHPTWRQPDEPGYLYIAEYCKKAVTDVKILSTSGHKNPDMMEAAIAEGKTDLIGMARQLIADPEFIQKLYEDRADDIVPCIRCNRCFEHCTDGDGPRTNRCTVNPLWGFESRETALLPPTRSPKRIAVVGGGAAGMESALYAKRRGHDVELFEKSDKLGGQLNTADYSPRKWALRQFRDYLVHQMEKQGIPVHLNADVTPEVIDEGGFDVVVAAMGSTPAALPIPGSDGANVYTVFDAYGNEESLGKRVAIVGGGSTGVETAMHLVEDFDAEVFVLEMTDTIGRDMPPTHYRAPFELEWAAMENLRLLTNARVTAILSDGVRYADQDGVEHTVPCDSAIMCTGMKSNIDAAMKLYESKARVVFVGDNRQPGNIMHLTRDALFAVSQL